MPEAQDARNVVWVVSLVARKFQRDTPRPAHPDDDEAGRGEDRVHVSVVLGHDIDVDGVLLLPIHAAHKTHESDICLLVLQNLT